MSKFSQTVVDAGVCDERGAAFCATAVRLPQGEFGMVLLGVNGNELFIYDIDMRSNIGEHLYTIPLKEITDLKINNGLLGEMIKGYSFKFNYEGFEWKFKNCAMKKNELAVIQKEAE